MLVELTLTAPLSYNIIKGQPPFLQIATATAHQWSENSWFPFSRLSTSPPTQWEPDKQ